MILTGIALGHVRDHAILHKRPPAADLSWDDLAEVTLATSTGEMHIEGWGGMTFDERNLAVSGPGEYRLRVSARGREDEWDHAVEIAQEEFRLDIWRAGAGSTTEVVAQVRPLHDRFR